MRRFHREPKRAFDCAAGGVQLSNAFKALRKLGLIAKQNFSCCGSCAGYALATRVSEMPEAKRNKVKGIVFYHRQDAERLPLGGETYLSYGQVGTQAWGDIGEPTVWIGEQIVKVLREHGLEAEWDGQPETRILVRFPGKLFCQCPMYGGHGHYSRCRQESIDSYTVTYESKGYDFEQQATVTKNKTETLALCHECAMGLLPLEAIL
jgi:hypothetical protein